MQKYLAGDQNAKNVLIERNLRLVAHVIKKYQGLDEDPEDLISIGTIGLIKAVSTFNPSKNNRLAAYAAKCVENEVLMYLRSRKNAPGKCLCTSPSAQIKTAMKSASWTLWKAIWKTLWKNIHWSRTSGFFTVL